jgi:hypothetical protein
MNRVPSGTFSLENVDYCSRLLGLEQSYRQPLWTSVSLVHGIHGDGKALAFVGTHAKRSVGIEN